MTHYPRNGEDFRVSLYKKEALMDTRIVQRSPQILGGAFVFRGTRVPIKTFIDYLEAGDRLEDLLEDFPTVTREQTVAVLELAKKTLLQDAGTP
jgi:uncharacterized protein (DUF433 family)